MKTLAICLNKLVQSGYTEHFMATSSGFCSLDTQHEYTMDEVNIVNFFRFEGSTARQPTTMYVIETQDGVKGVLVDATNKLSMSSLMAK